MGDGHVELTFLDGSTTSVALPWLREVCSCGACRYLETGRRRLEALSTPPAVSATSIVVATDRAAVVVDWHDGHRSEVSAQTIMTGPARVAPSPITLWDGELMNRLPVVAHDDVVAEREAQLTWLSLVQELGFAIVSGVPATRAALSRVAGMVGPIRPSNYEPIWAIEAVADPENEVVSGSALSPHTDLPYRQIPPGLQFLLSVVADLPGGASTLVDGFRIADRIRAESTDHWRALTETPVRYRFVDGSSDFEFETPTVEVRPDGSYGIIRHAPGLLAPLDPDPTRFEPLYAALRRFTELTNDPAFQVVHRLEPGEMLTFDNHRLLHGRQAVDLGSGGRRHLLGAYVDRDELSSRLRVLQASTA
jgi:gamma-butyrobetaine dioxygenase